LLEDPLDGQLLNLLQTDFPLVVRPFREMGQRLGMEEEEALKRVSRMKEQGLIRRISAVIDWRKLGFRSTLVAISLPEERLDKAASIINKHPGVTHNYARRHRFNLWFTLTLPPEGDPDREAHLLSSQVRAEAALSLPALKVFKITATFNMLDSSSPIMETASKGNGEVAPSPSSLSSEDMAVLRGLNRDLPLEESPFEFAANLAGLSMEGLLDRSRALLQSRVVRRFGAVVHHLRAGFNANALSCWRIPAERIEAVGTEVASFATVSHCYERRVNSEWPHNLFAMLHAEDEKTCQASARNIATATGIADYVLLFTQREYKKERLGYLDREGK
jgi:DNA-binding Lrp family transcriptional regulator